MKITRDTKCTCNHPRYVHSDETRTSPNGGDLRETACMYCDCTQFNPKTDEPALTAQQRVVGAVSERGYLDGWTPAQLVARQVCKLQEELSELSECVAASPYLEGEAFHFQVQKMGVFARRLFDEHAEWGYEPTADVEALKKEAADIQVVLFCLAASIEAMTAAPFDVVSSAVEKATADVQRGVRA